MRTKILLLFIFGIVFSSLPARAKLAYIYHGPGSCKTCPEAVAVLLQKMGMQTKYIYPGGITYKKLARAVLYVQPGGSDRIEDTLEVLGEGEVQAIRKFVGEGGHYLGICAGAYLAGRYTEHDHKTRAFDFADTVVQEEFPIETALLTPVHWLNQTHLMYVQSAPALLVEKFPYAKSWAVYEHDGNSAALTFPFARGYVGLIGPHLEALERWYTDDLLPVNKPEMAAQAQLAMDFIRSLLSQQK